MAVSEAAAPSSGEHFLRNVLWGWTGVVFSLLSGILLSPYIIHHLGDERYGIWALGFSVIDYYNLVDFGFRSAVLKYVAHYRVTGELDRIEEIVSTALTYFSIAAILLLCATAVMATYFIGFFRITPQNIGDFRFVIVTVGIGVSFGAVMNSFGATLEAHQRFDISSRIDIVNSALRISGCFLALYFGFGIKALALSILTGQMTGYFLTYRAVGRVLPNAVFSVHKVTRRALRQLAGYGAHTFMANTSFMVMSQDGPLLIGHFLSASWVAYFAYPWRLLFYSSDLVGRLGMVTGAKTAELMAYDDISGIARMTLIVNRYCLMLFLPLAFYLSIFGRQLLYVWINPNFALNSEPVIPWLATGVVIAISAGHNSTSVLYGMAKQQILARAAFTEACCNVAGLWFIVPRYGIVGAAAWIATLMIISRGIYVPWEVARNVRITFRQYLAGIYGRPLSIGLPVAALTWFVNRAIGQPVTWSAVILGGGAMTAVYFGAVYLWGLEPQHRRMMVNMALRSVNPLTRWKAA